MRIGLIDVDNARLKKPKYPNLALMKISAWHKTQGDHVEWWNGLEHYDRVYMSKVFSEEYTPDIEFAIQADEVIRGGSGYCIETINGVEHYRPELGADLPEEIEHIYPDYGLYPELTKDTAYVSRNESKRLTKAQKEFLFEYFYERGLRDKAKDYLED